MTAVDFLTERFEEHRPRLRGIAYRMLGSLSEADDAVQETWIRYDRSDLSEVENLGGWLTTVLSRVCLNFLRSRGQQGEEPLETHDDVRPDAESGPEDEAMLADSVGLALLVVLDTLGPAERVAFVLHDLFAVPFEEIAPLIEKSPAATRQIASRARRRVRGVPAAPEADLRRQRTVVEAFRSASRAGDFEALVALLDPDVVFRADRAVVPSPQPVFLRGAHSVARGARIAGERVRFTGLALVDGRVGLVMAPRGRLAMVLVFTTADDKITGIEIIAEPDRLKHLDLAVLDL